MVLECRLGRSFFTLTHTHINFPFLFRSHIVLLNIYIFAMQLIPFVFAYFSHLLTLSSPTSWRISWVNGSNSSISMFVHFTAFSSFKLYKSPPEDTSSGKIRIIDSKKRSRVGPAFPSKS